MEILTANFTGLPSGKESPAYTHFLERGERR
jgi:hypothetical protein